MTGVDIRYEMFLSERIGMVDADDFSSIYADAKEWFNKAEEIGTLTDIFLACDIEPHNYFTYAIPSDYAYGSNNITDVTIADSIERINSDAFTNSSLESVSFGYNSRLISIGMYAFLDCINLRNIHLPDSLEVLSAGVFQGCNYLENVYFGKNIIRMNGDDIFKYCNKVTIHCYKGTKPHEYAIQHGIKFELIK